MVFQKEDLRKNTTADKYNGTSYTALDKIGKMHGAKRVIAFCCLTALLPAILIITPLYLRHSTFADVIYTVAESDIVEIVQGISSVFCQAHYLQMNTSFNAFQLKGTPSISDKMKHIRLKKSMLLPDDTFEYWGFFLLKGAVVKLKVCSRYEGSRILVVKGGKHLETCKLLDINQQAVNTKMDDEHLKVKVTFEKPAVEIGVIDEDDLKNNTAVEELDEGDVDNYITDRLNRGRMRLNELSNSTEHIKNQTSETKQSEVKNLNHIEVTDKPARNRTRREKNFDAHIEHGGNAPNKTKSEESSVSSFETELLTCYNGQILLAQEFPPSHLCKDVHYLENSSSHMQTFHEVGSDGYYYYIFYSDNDDPNNIHAVFDIFKPTYRFSNSSTEKSCINVTECTFSMSFWSDEIVIVEVPTRDGIEHEADDITYLLSRCQPRMTVYMIFPILVLFLILGCAFI